MGRRTAREKALQILYQTDLIGASPETAIDNVLSESELPAQNREFTVALVNGTLQHLGLIDRIIARYAIDWNIERMAVVDRNILRMACYELFYMVETPPNVVLNEAIELAKCFSTEDAGKFINGILDKVLKSLPELKEDLGVETDR